MFVRATGALTSIARTVTTPILLLSLVQCGFGGGFFPNFVIFALVSAHLRNFNFYSWASLLVLLFFAPPAYSPLSLSPKVTSLGGFSCSPPSLVVPVFVFGNFSFCSSGAVSSSSSSCWGSRRLLLYLLGVSVQLVLEHLRFFRSVSCSWWPFWGSPAG